MSQQPPETRQREPMLKLRCGAAVSKPLAFSIAPGPWGQPQAGEPPSLGLSALTRMVPPAVGGGGDRYDHSPVLTEFRHPSQGSHARIGASHAGPGSSPNSKGRKSSPTLRVTR